MYDPMARKAEDRYSNQRHANKPPAVEMGKTRWMDLQTLLQPLRYA
jgi:hypothetical protein